MRKKTSKKTKHSRRYKHQHVYNMIGCSKKHKHTKKCLKKLCPICGLKGGSSGCGANGCPIAPLSWSEMNKFVKQNGGECNVMGCQPILGVGQNGGSNHMDIPGPFVGSAWGPNDNQLPGANGIAGDRNYLASYSNVIQNDPTRQISMNDANFKPILKGGRKKTRKNYKKSLKRGGGLIPQDLVNLGREVGFNFKSAYNAINGYKAPINPLPYKDQLQSSTIAIMSK
uniref:Uncharacterized protein n=1 Tax=viral metagenome TaxID=1070528 RepID=A0A6C0IW87_9ZZZZ